MKKGTRWVQPVPAPDFAMFPGVIFRDVLPLMNGSEVQVFIQLAFEAYRWRREVASISTRRLAQRCDLSRTTVRRALDALIDAWFIEVLDLRIIGGNETTVYRIRITEDPRYTSNWGGSNIGPGGGPKSGPPEGQKLAHTASGGLSRSIKERKERDHTSSEKYFRGRYAVCGQCGSLPCVCEE